MRPILCLLLLLLAAGPARAETAFHTLVLRGRTLAADGSPLTSARVITRGSVSASSMSDGQGRWSLTTPMGSAASLARDPFTLEVRAEAAGRRLPLASGGSALLLEVSLVQRDGRAVVRVRSNQPSAAAGVATAFAQEGHMDAWVEADFGGASRAGGNELRFTEEALVPGLAPPAGTPAAGPPPTRPGATPPAPASPRANAAPPASPPPVRANAETSRTQPVREKPAGATADAERRAAETAAKRRADSLATARRAAGVSAERRAAEAAAKRRADSLATARRAMDQAARRQADSLLTVRREERRAASRRYDSLAVQRASIRSQDSLEWVAARTRRAEDRLRERAAEQARIDSLAQWRRERRRADSLEWVARHAATPAARTERPSAPAPATERTPVSPTPPVAAVAIPPGTGQRAHAVVPVPAGAFDSLRTAQPETYVVGVAPTPAREDTARRTGSASAVTGERVKRIEPFAPPPAPHVAPDSCVCRLRGTVEVAWADRPLEQRIPVTVTLAGPVAATRRVELFMGPPREFRFGPMPCGDYRVTVKTQARLRYGLVTGDRELVVRCEGSGEVRLVLEPQKR